MRHFAERLRQLRLAAGLTQEQLGFAVEVTKSSVSAWENGRETPSFRSLPLLKEALGCSLDVLLLGDPADDEAIYKKPAFQARDCNEQRLLAIYRQMPPRQRKALFELLVPWDESR